MLGNRLPYRPTLESLVCPGLIHVVYRGQEGAPVVRCRAGLVFGFAIASCITVARRLHHVPTACFAQASLETVTELMPSSSRSARQKASMVSAVCERARSIGASSAAVGETGVAQGRRPKE